MIGLKEIKDSLLHLLFPHVCSGCGTDVLNEGTMLCIRCLDAMPETNFELHEQNPVERMFWGRLPLAGATAQFYFNKESLMQHLMYEFKYKGNKELGYQFGRLMGEQLKRSGRFPADAIVPLPLFPAKERKRGFNQAAVLSEGIAGILHLPVLKNVICRPQHTETQTRKGRIERWKNMDGKFVLTESSQVRNKHLLLVDDVVTTGATLESCGLELLKGENTSLSIATFCIASR